MAIRLSHSVQCKGNGVRLRSVSLVSAVSLRTSLAAKALSVTWVIGFTSHQTCRIPP